MYVYICMYVFRRILAIKTFWGSDPKWQRRSFDGFHDFA